MRVSKTLQHIVQVKYRIEGEGTAMKGIGSKLLQAPQKFPAFEQLSKMDSNGETTIIARFFVDEASFDALGLANPREPMPLSDEKLTGPLRESIESHMSVRRRWQDDRIIDGSCTITKFQLNVYASSQFYLKVGDVHWYLTGDAAAGFPFFRSLNAGFLSGTELSKTIINDYFRPERASKATLESPGKAYDETMQTLTRSEAFWAGFKNAGLKVSFASHALSHESVVSTTKAVDTCISSGNKKLSFSGNSIFSWFGSSSKNAEKEEGEQFIKSRGKLTPR